MFTIIEPKAFPIATPTSSMPVAAKTETLSSGNVVSNAMNIKPMIVFPSPLSPQL